MTDAAQGGLGAPSFLFFIVFFFFFFSLHINSEWSFKRCLKTRGRPRGAPRRVQMLLKSSSGSTPWQGLVDRLLWVTGLGPGSYSPPAFQINIRALKGGRGSRGIPFLMTQRLADIPTVQTHLRVCVSPCAPAPALLFSFSSWPRPHGCKRKEESVRELQMRGE